MSIIDQYGQPYRYSSKFAHGANNNGNDGPRYRNVLDDIQVLIPQHDRRTLQSLSRRLYTNFGVLKSAVDQKASYSVGNAWTPRFRSPDIDRAQAAHDWTRDRFLPLCDVRGATFHWQSTLQLWSQGIDRDGEAFVLLTESDNGEPRIQTIPSHRIGQRDSGEKVVESGGYVGLRIRDGIIANKVGRAVAYRVLGDSQDGSEDKDISARNLIHLFDPDFAEQQRGLPAFTHALKDFLHCLQSTEYERIAQLMISSMGLIEYNEMGGPSSDDPGHQLTAGNTAADGLTSQLYAGGTTRYFKSNSGNKLEQITHDRPGDVWEKFHDRMIRAGLAGVQWPMALVWKSPGQGTAERQEVVRARRSIDARQGLLKRAAQRIVSYAVGKAIDNGDLEPFKRFWDVDFTLPARLTVDDGRETAGLLKAYEAGVLNMTELQDYKGKSVDDHFRERALETAARKRITEEVAAATGEEITEEDMGVDGRTPAPAAPVEDSNAQQIAEFETLKAKFDSYGVGVRAGALTPMTDDEAAFREVAGLPKMSKDVARSWKEDKGTRRPITILPSGGEPAPAPAQNQQTDDNEND